MNTEFDYTDRKVTPLDPSASSLRSWITRAHEKQRRIYPKGSSAVLIPVLIRDGSYHVLYEVRAAKLKTQPGEICFPGGRIEEGEEPIEAAVREATEELCIKKDQIELVGALDETIGPGGIPFFAFIGVLHGYEGTWSADEVEYVFTLPLEWILSHDPDIYKVKLEQKIPEDFPYDMMPGGRGYKWRSQNYAVPFYPELEPVWSGRVYEGEKAQDSSQIPVLWGVTARVTHSLAKLLRADDLIR